MLADPFPNPETKLVANQTASRSQVLMLSISKQQNDALTRSKYYGNPQLSNNKANEKPSNSTITSTEFVPMDSNLVSFDHKGYDPQLPAQLAFLIQVKALNKTVHRTIIDEGASTCIMSMSCWKNLGSPSLSRSSTMLKSFDG